jgi:hypothetical protein
MRSTRLNVLQTKIRTYISNLLYPYPALLAMQGEIERLNPAFRREDDIDRVCECAIVLVHLGPNCHVNLPFLLKRRNAPVNPKDPGDG